MKLSAILEPLVEAGVDAATILKAVKAWEAEQASAVDEGKEKARERWRRWKAKQPPTNADKRLPTLANDSCEGVTRVEDITSNLEISGKTENKKEAAPSARPSRGTRIPNDFVPDLNAAVADGLSRQDAEHQARQFIDYWRAKAGRDAVKVDWPATWRVWYRRNLSKPSSQAPPNRRRNYVDVAMDRMNGHGSEGIFGDSGDAQRIPAGQQQPGRDDENVRGGLARRFIQSSH